MAQVIGQLPNKCKALSLNPRIIKKKKEGDTHTNTNTYTYMYMHTHIHLINE
jgi:hypothetical protein